MDCSVDLYNKICEVINDNPLPISIKYFIIKDIFREVENGYKQHLFILEKEEKERQEIKEE